MQSSRGQRGEAGWCPWFYSQSPTSPFFRSSLSVGLFPRESEAAAQPCRTDAQSGAPPPPRNARKAYCTRPPLHCYTVHAPVAVPEFPLSSSKFKRLPTAAGCTARPRRCTASVAEPPLLVRGRGTSASPARRPSLLHVRTSGPAAAATGSESLPYQDDAASLAASNRKITSIPPRPGHL